MSWITGVGLPREREIPLDVLTSSLYDPGPNSSLISLQAVGPEGSGAWASPGTRYHFFERFHQYLSESLREHVRVSNDPIYLASFQPADTQKSATWYYTLQVPLAASGCLISANIPLDSAVRSSTAFKETAATSKSEIQKIFELAELVEFEDGTENAFTQQLAILVRKNGSAAVEELASTMFGVGISPEVGAQVLLCLGRIDDDASYLARSWVVQRGLFSPSSKVRDAAAVGIASLKDAHAATSLAKAIEKERIHDLREDMERVLLYLQAAA